MQKLKDMYTFDKIRFKHRFIYEITGDKNVTESCRKIGITPHVYSRVLNYRDLKLNDIIKFCNYINESPSVFFKEYKDVDPRKELVNKLKDNRIGYAFGCSGDIIITVSNYIDLSLVYGYKWIKDNYNIKRHKDSVIFRFKN